MNQRILKKLARRAEAVFFLMKEARICQLDLYPGDDDSVPIGIGNFERKHCDRSKSIHNDNRGDRAVIIKAKKLGRRFPYIRIFQPSESWPGVPYHSFMTGGYDCVEYDAVDLYSELVECVQNHFQVIDVDEDGEPNLGKSADVSNPKRVFALAARMLQEAKV